jgi:hypothetical protein
VNKALNTRKAPATLLEVLLEDDPSERVCYGCGYAHLVEALMSVACNALEPVVNQLDDRPELQEQLKNAQRLTAEYRSLFRAHRLAMTQYVQEQKLLKGKTIN